MNPKINKKWKNEIDEIFLILNKRIFIAVLIFIKLMFICLLIENSLSSKLKIFHIPYYVPVCIILVWVFIFFVNRISTKQWEYISYIIMIIFFDSLTIFGVIIAFLVKDDKLFIRGLYYEICFSLMYLNINIDLSILKLYSLMIYKLVIFSIILTLYNYEINLEEFFIFDLYMIILSLGITIVYIIMSKILWKKLAELSKKNNYLTVNNIFNASKSPIISINLMKNKINFNIAIIQFFQENFHEEKYKIKYLFDDNYKEEIVFQNITENELNFIEKLSNNSKNKTKYKSFKSKILILNNIFSNFISESNEFFNFFNFIMSERNFGNNEFFEMIGEYKINFNKEKYIEFNWRKSNYFENEKIIHFMLNDLSTLREIQFTKAENKYKKIYLAKIAHEFKTPINSMIYSLTNLFEKYPQLEDIQNYEIKKKIEFIQAQGNFISILTHDINDYCKGMNEIDVNLDKVEIRVILKFAFDILEVLISKDKHKKENVNCVRLFSDLQERFLPNLFMILLHIDKPSPEPSLFKLKYCLLIFEKS